MTKKYVKSFIRWLHWCFYFSWFYCWLHIVYKNESNFGARGGDEASVEQTFKRCMHPGPLQSTHRAGCSPMLLDLGVAFSQGEQHRGSARMLTNQGPPQAFGNPVYEEGLLYIPTLVVAAICQQEHMISNTAGDANWNLSA